MSEIKIFFILCFLFSMNIVYSQDTVENNNENPEQLIEIAEETNQISTIATNETLAEDIVNNQAEDITNDTGLETNMEESLEILSKEPVTTNVIQDSNLGIEINTEDSLSENISNEFVFYVNPILNRELLTFKTNITVFTNDMGIYHLNITFHRDNRNYPIEKKMVMNFILQTKLQLMPYDTYGQKIDFIMVGGDNQLKWETPFYFDKNQASFSRTKNIYTYKLTKRLSFWDRENFYRILNSNQTVYFQVKGLSHNFYFLFMIPINNFYKSFLNHAKSLNFYE